jgi:hypothetical protein
VVLCGSAAGNPQGNFDHCPTAFRHHQTPTSRTEPVAWAGWCRGVVRIRQNATDAPRLHYGKLVLIPGVASDLFAQSSLV